VSIAEYNPFEFVKTNILGSQNLIEACLDNNPENVIAISTDKAVSPINLYGATKLASDKLFLAANNIKGKRKVKFSVARYGNVMASRGSVIPFFIEQSKKGYLPITDLNMTRFNISITDAVNFVIWTLQKNIGGEIFIPKMPSYRITDLAKAVDNKSIVKVVGIRPGEKIEEELLSKAENYKTIDLGNCYVVVGTTNDKTEKYYSTKKFIRLKEDFLYTSGTNEKFLSVKDLKNLINKNFLSLKNK
jgi:FlaA1/EpsC-like NDP-sugar epimerase